MTLRLALIDDHILFREGLRALLHTKPDLRVVAEASDATQAVQVLDETQPEVAIMDVALPGDNGVTLTRELRRRLPQMRVLILSMHEATDFVAQALGAGALGYALKDQRAEEIVDAIRSVARGQSYLSPRIPRSVVERAAAASASGGGPLETLSPREREIFDLLIQGASTASVAATLGISAKTVETHRGHINKKLGVHSTAELIRLAARHRLIAV
jgi:DNA-binding NarL/FixJ family response regulator